MERFTKTIKSQLQESIDHLNRRFWKISNIKHAKDFPFGQVQKERILPMNDLQFSTESINKNTSHLVLSFIMKPLKSNAMEDKSTS